MYRLLTSNTPKISHITYRLPVHSNYKTIFQHQPSVTNANLGQKISIANTPSIVQKATIPTRPIDQLKQQYQQQMQQKHKQPPPPSSVAPPSATNMQVKLSASQLQQLMDVDNNGVVNVSIKYSNGTPGNFLIFMMNEMLKCHIEQDPLG